MIAPLKKNFRKKLFISLKSKVLTVLVTLLLITVVFNLLYSYNLFINDKVSYIFESGLKHAESLSDQLNFKAKELKTIASLQNSTGLADVDFQKIIDDQNEVLIVGQIETDGNILKITKNNSLLNKLKDKKFYENLQVGQSVFHPESYKLNQFDILKINESASVFIYFTKLKSSYYNFVLLTNDSISAIFNNNSLFASSYINIQKPDKDFYKLAKLINDFPTGKGTLEFENKNDMQLVSFVKMNNSDFVVISKVSRKKAFQVTKYLITQTILFGLFLLGILVAIGVYFSASLTGPILKLTEIAKGIAARDFSKQFVITTRDEISILGNTFNHMSIEIESLLIAKEEMIVQLKDANLKLEEYNQGLELKVEERTVELKQANHFMETMVNSLDQGLMVFDNELKCHKIHTIACNDLFGIDPHGKTFPEILGLTSEHDVESLNDWSHILFSELLPFESAILLGPQEKISGHDVFDTSYKNILINYYSMKDDNQKLQNIVVVATDKTKEIQSIEESKRKEAYVNMIVKILSNKSQFQSFIEVVYSTLDQLQQCISADSSSLNIENAMMLLHTLNGGFGLYFLTSLQKIAIGYESEISKLKTEEKINVDHINQFLANVANLRNEFNKCILTLDQNLRTNFTSSESSREIDLSIINTLKNHIDFNHSDKIKDFFYEYFIKEPIINSFKPYSDLVKSISKIAGKNINEIKFENENIRIDPNQFKEFFNVLIHLFRNCVDHGIEVESVRRKIGKSPEGNISVAFDVLNRGKVPALSITVKDDGAGINPVKIKEKLCSLYPTENFDSLPDNELIRKIFDPFFSTRDEVSLLSGRGVGMSAISDIVDKMDGDIIIQSQVGFGTTFTFIVPMF